MARRSRQGVLAEADAWSPLRTIGWGLPGPVWTLALWQGLICLNLAIWWLVGNNTWSSRYLAAVLYAAAISAVATGVLLVLSYRTPVWLIHSIVVLGIVTCIWLMGSADDNTMAVLPIWGVLPVPVFVAFWFSRRVAVAFTAVAVAGVFVGTLTRTDRLTVELCWLCFASFSVTLVVVMTTLVNSLRRRALMDLLTGLMNRDGLNALIELQPRAGRLSVPRTVVLIDLNDFKSVNDTEGHQAGDAVLRGVGAAIRSVVRPDDIAARTGGDEFVLVLPATSVEDSSAVVARLREAMPIAFSSGAADWPPDTKFATAVRTADQRMYEAKERGRH